MSFNINEPTKLKMKPDINVLPSAFRDFHLLELLDDFFVLAEVRLVCGINTYDSEDTRRETADRHQLHNQRTEKDHQV